MTVHLESYEGLTFASSVRGRRYERINSYLFMPAIGCGFILRDLIAGDEVSWNFSLTLIVVGMFVSWITSGIRKSSAFRGQVVVGADYLDLMDSGVSAHIPWRDILYIRIDRSPSGHRRNIRIRARGGRLFALLDPEQGELLESWALEVGREAGIKITLRKWVTLNAEPVWVFLFYVFVMVTFQLAMTHGWL